MKRHSFKSKIITPTVITLALLVIAITVYSSIKFTNYTSNLISERIAVTANGLKSFLIGYERETKSASVSMSINRDMIKAVRDRDTKEIIQILTPTLDLFNIGYYTVTDASGIVLARTHAPDSFGDSVIEQQSIKNALDGKFFTCYEEGVEAKVSIRTGSPVYDIDGTLIGVVSAVVNLDSNALVENLKERFDADITVFWGDVRVATTIIIDGASITGTHLASDIAKIVIEDKMEYFGNSDILGENFSTYYLPLMNPQGHVFAILFAGKSNTQLIAARNNFIITGFFIGLIGLSVSVTLLMFITTKIVKPVSGLTHIVSKVAQGNIDFEIDKTQVTNDEIGILMLDIYSLVDVVKSTLSDLSQLTYDMSIFKDIDFQIDTGKYSGSYKEIIDRIKILADSISMMNKTMAVLDFIDMMISVTDLDYNLLYINSRAAEYYGIDRKNCLGKKCYQVLRNLDRPCHVCQLPKLLPEKDSFPSIEYEYLWDENSSQWFGGRAAIARWIDGTMVYFNAINDISMKIKQQEKLREALDEAKAASTAKSAFLANMSHEIRTPLNVVMGLADLKLEEENLSGDIKDTLQKMRNAGSTLLSIVNDVLDISKVESGKLSVTSVEYHMASVLNDTVTVVTTRIGEKPIVFILDITDDLPSRLFGDDLRVKQILNNLLSNAIKYTNNGTIKLKVNCTREGEGVWMDIIVSDTGIGIRDENLKNMFTDYYQVDALATRKIEGTGLGLSITRRLAEIMDGEISVESEYGRGSDFRVRIRQGYVTDEPIGPVVAENLRQFRYNENKRIFADKLIRDDLSYARVLVVDDMQANLDVSAGFMRKYKMRVDCVTSGHDAIERIKRGNPVYNAIFMDHMMPEMDGIETTDAIRALGTEYARNVPIIALTANAIAGTEEMFYKHDFQAFLSKPIDIMRLDSIIRHWIKDKSKEKVNSSSPEETAISDMHAFNPPPVEEKHFINIQGIDAETGLSACDGDWKIYQSVLRSYVTDASLVLEKTRDVSEESLSKYIIAVHGIKGSSASIGAGKIRETAANLEAMGKAGDLSGILAQNEAFQKDVSCLVADIQAWLNEHDANRIKPQLHAPDRSLLADLRQSCEDCDINNIEKIMDELESASYEKDADLVAWLREKIDMMDYIEVSERLAEMVNP